MAQVEYLRLGLIIDQSQHDYREIGLKLRLHIKLIEHHLRICVTLELNDDTHTVAVGLVTQVGYALKALFLDLLGNGADKLALIDLIRKLGDDYADAILAELLKLAAGTHRDLAAAGCVGLTDAASAHNNTLGREVRTLNILHKVGNGRLGVIQNADACVDDLAQVVRRDIRRHADGDTRRAVDQKVREAGGENTGLFSRLVKVCVPVDGVLRNIAQHLVCNAAHPRLGVSVCSRGVAVYRAEVAVTVNEHVAHGEILRQSDHCIVYRCVAVGVVPTEHVADAGSRLFKRLVAGQAVLVQGVKYSAVNGL